MKSLILVAVLAFVAHSEAGPAINPFIIRGKDAYPGEFPYIGSLQRLGFSTNGVRTYARHTCGCVLISNQWVVTAGHCVGAGANGLQVVMGMHKRLDSSVGEPKEYQISYIRVHPGWTGRIGTTDAALIRLRRDVVWSRYARPISFLARDRDDFTGQTCTISGWGVTREGFGSAANTLQKAQVPVLSLADCQRSFTGSVNEGHICIGGGGSNAAGSCNGDSGGPLVCNGYLAGVTSFGIRGCYTFYPSVYTRIGYVRDWIRTTSGV